MWVNLKRLNGAAGFYAYKNYRLSIGLKLPQFCSRLPHCLNPLLLPVMSTLVECVPNFSEGRDKAVVDAIVEAMKVPGV